MTHSRQLSAILESQQTDVQVLRELPDPMTHAQRYRSTWLVSSLEGLKLGGYYERYLRLLDSHRREVLETFAGAWVPIAAARAHYDACDLLDLTDSEYAQLVRQGAKVRRTWNERMLKNLETPDTTPWQAIDAAARAWDRTVDGGGLGVYRLADNRARLLYDGCELFEIPYFRRAVRVMLHVLVGRACPQLFVQDHGSGAREAEYVLHWRI